MNLNNALLMEIPCESRFDENKQACIHLLQARLHHPANLLLSVELV